MYAKRSLGQNFLTSRSIVGDIIEAAGVAEGDTILEIGPGKGILTRALLATGAQVIAVEKDDRLSEQLQSTFTEEVATGALHILHGDILKDDMLIQLTGFPEITNGSYKIVANIPYNITGRLFRIFLESGPIPSSMTLMLQKEVAKGIVADKGKHSILSVSTNAYGTPKYVRTVPARYFSPKPKVDSAVLHLGNISRSLFGDVSEEAFFRIVKTGFASKRKLLLNNLEKLIEDETNRKDRLRDIFHSCNINDTVRAEELGPTDWKCLAQKLNT